MLHSQGDISTKWTTAQHQCQLAIAPRKSKAVDLRARLFDIHIMATKNTLTLLNMMIPIRKRHRPQPTFVARSLASTTQKELFIMAESNVVASPGSIPSALPKSKAVIVIHSRRHSWKRKLRN
ncbi:hypothetical protein PGTUg99_012892 [Puccinia graminis f. sp. tritici]|nr:hypothetical protein PGTUg99_012892 [Puccinia graminis f. sp. tritici]